MSALIPAQSRSRHRTLTPGQALQLGPRQAQIAGISANSAATPIKLSPALSFPDTLPACVRGKRGSGP